MQTLLIALMVWINANLGYTVELTPPNVEYKTYYQLHTLAYAGEVPFDSVKPVIQALYIEETETIYLPVGFVPKAPEQLAVLVHELVHHIQNLSGKKFKCKAAQELDAYDLQDKFLKTMGMKIEDVGINWLFVAMVSTCDRRNNIDTNP